MEDFIMHYGVCIILCAIGLFFVIMTYSAHFTERSGVPLIGGLLIAIGFLSSPLKWPALLGLIDPGYWSIPYFALLDHMREKRFAAAYSEHDYTEKTADDKKRLRIWIPERNEELIRPYRTNSMYQLQIPRLLFSVCIDKTGKRFILFDKLIKGGHIETLPLYEDSIVFDGLKVKGSDMTVKIEIIEADDNDI